MRRALEIYQYLGPALFTPLALWLWWRHYDAWPPALVAWTVPILWAYIVPGVGTNVLKVWEFDVRFKLGRFRPHHGFVFGSATSMLAWLVHTDPAHGLFDVVKTSVVLACVLGFINLLYDIKALECGLLKVYNQPWAEGRGPSDVALDYAPWFFGGFGACYGAGLALMEWRWADELTTATVGPLIIQLLLVSIALPVAGYVVQSKLRHGHWGVLPVEKIG
jgi:hypothetical protein